MGYLQLGWRCGGLGLSGHCDVRDVGGYNSAGYIASIMLDVSCGRDYRTGQ